MFTRRRILVAVAAGSAAGLLSVSLLAGGQQSGKPMTGHDMAVPMTSMTKMTKAQKIANAMTAAPASVSASATVLDWPAQEGGAPVALRAGTNGWTCFPDMPDTKGSDPMCVDDTWMKWLDAYLAHKSPEITRVGIGYMMAAGGAWGSNSDPFAMTETRDNHWGHHTPHMMIVVPDQKSLAGISTDPTNGGPYVMWAGTPYAHIMAPTASSR